MGCNPLYSLTWDDFGNSLQSNVQLMRSHGDFVDVTLTAGGKLYPAHKVVLSAASPLLMELFKSTQCQHPVLLFAGIASTDLESILQFVYHGEVCVDTSQLPSFLQAAQCLDIQALSPSFLSSEKTRTEIMNGVHHSGLSIPPKESVRKRKKKPRPFYLTDPGDESQDTEDDKDLSLKKPNLVSEHPVSCNICGIVLRQSRNLKRHIELVHTKSDMGGGRKSKKSLVNDGTQSESDNHNDLVEIRDPKQLVQIQHDDLVSNDPKNSVAFPGISSNDQKNAASYSGMTSNEPKTSTSYPGLLSNDQKNSSSYSSSNEPKNTVAFPGISSSHHNTESKNTVAFPGTNDPKHSIPFSGATSNEHKSAVAFPGPQDHLLSQLGAGPSLLFQQQQMQHLQQSQFMSDSFYRHLSDSSMLNALHRDSRGHNQLT